MDRKAMKDIVIQSKLPRKITPVVLRQVVKDMAAMIRQMPLDDEEASELYRAVSYRVRHKTCGRCNELKPVAEMERLPINGNLQDVRWVCNECK